eukprot:NODE_495_length_6825_cov_1.481267.p3 type:complete len:246 gc:universal NODE_495_length_6825_cov_1.481267:386-1123(+)
MKKRYFVLPALALAIIYYTKSNLRRSLLSNSKESNISRRYKHFQMDLRFTMDQILALLDIKEIDLDLILQSLSQFKNSDKVLIEGEYRDKLSAWNLFKSKCIQKLITKLYCSSALCLLVNIQMNILGKYLYLQSVGELNNSKICFTSKLSQSKFLELTNYIIEEGWRKLHVDLSVVECVELNQALTCKDFSKVIQSVREKIEIHDINENFKNIILPDPVSHIDMSDHSVVGMARLNSELYDVVER